MFTQYEMTAEMPIQIDEWRTGRRSEISLQDGMRWKQMGREMAPELPKMKVISLFWLLIERRLSHGQVKIFTDLNACSFILCV